jgi:hypothetical protein
LHAALHRTAGWSAATALAGVVILAAGIAQTRAGHSVLQAAGLYQEPAGYTSLAFLHPQSLPENLSARHVQVGVSFVIRNSGSDTRRYQWSVLLIRAGRTRRVAAGDAKVRSGHATAITRPASVSCTQGRLQIVVKLARPVETIDAWTACWSPGS